MRTYSFKRPCGHLVRGTRKAKALASVCLDCWQAPQCEGTGKIIIVRKDELYTEASRAEMNDRGIE